MAGSERSIPVVFPQAVSVENHGIAGRSARSFSSQSGKVGREFAEAVVIALLSFAVGLAIGAMLCREFGSR